MRLAVPNEVFIERLVSYSGEEGFGVGVRAVLWDFRRLEGSFVVKEERIGWLWIMCLLYGVLNKLYI
jgi:hypothetical protein